MSHTTKLAIFGLAGVAGSVVSQMWGILLGAVLAIGVLLVADKAGWLTHHYASELGRRGALAKAGRLDEED